MTSILDRPIFFIGMPRSGTTLLFEPFARHPELGWHSNYSQKYPDTPWLNVLDRLFRSGLLDLAPRKLQYGKKILGNRFIPFPDEAYNFWDRYCAVDFSRSYLLDVKLAPESVASVRSETEKILRWQGRHRLTAKFTGPSRIAFLRQIFPDALFVHILRDGRAVTHSLLRVPFWKEKGGFSAPFWNGGLPREAVDLWRSQGSDPGVLAAVQWSHIVDSTRAEGLSLGGDSYMELRYEDFVEDPGNFLMTMYSFADLPDSESGIRVLETGPPVKNMNFKYLGDFEPAYVEELTVIMQSSLRKFGYLEGN